MANITKIYEVKLQGQGVVLDEMKKVNKEFDNASKKWKEFKKLFSQGGLSSADNAKFTQEMAQAKLETERLRQETIRLKNENLALSNATKQQAAEQKKARDETRASTSAWKELLKQLNDARNNAKNIAVKFGIDSSEFKAAQKEANAFDQKVKQIESRLGQFQRNVGNYPGNQMLQGLNTNTLQALIKSGFGSIIANQVNLAKERTKELDAQFTLLKNKLASVRTNATGDLDAIQREIMENRIEAQKLNAEVGRIQNEFRNATSMGARMADNLKTYFRNLRNEIATFLVGYLSFQAAFAKGQEMIQNSYEIADGVTAIEVELQKAAGGAENLVEKLAQLDTRTKLPELLNIGNIAIKAGVEESDLVGVVSAIDKIKIAFGKDFGDVETGTESLVKLINVFEDGQVTEDKMLRTGNAVRTIANESVASVPYLNDFAKRMAGVKGISEITLPAVLGLASGFEQYGQSAETTSTALVRIIPKIAADTEKFAKIAGMTQKAFSQLLNENPDQALIKVAEGLTKNKKGLEDLISSFQDSDLAAKGGAGITSTIAVLGKNAETFKKTIESAKNAYQDTSNITDAFAKRNENLSASMDKLKKGFVDAARNERFQAFLKGSIALIVALGGAISGIPLTAWYVLIGMITLAYYENIKAVTISLARQTAQIALTIASNALMTASNILIRLQTAAVYLANIAWTALNSTMLYLGTIFPAIRSAWISLNIAILATPTGWLIAGFAAVAGALALLVAATEDSAESLRKQGQAAKQTAAEIRVNAEITRKATESTVDQISKIEILTRVLRDNNVGLDTKKRALQELININPQVLNALTLENIKTKEGLDLLIAYKNQLLEVAKAKAAQSLLESKTQQIIQNELKISELNEQLSKRYGKDVSALKQAKNAIADVIRGYASDIGLGSGDVGKQIIELTNENKKLKADQDVLLQKVAGDNTKGIVTGITNNATVAGVAKETLTTLKAELDALNKEFEETETKTKRYYELQAEIAKKQAYYDSLTKKEKPNNKASRLTGVQKDFVKDLEAQRNNELAEVEKNFYLGEIAEKEFIKKSLEANIKYYDAKIGYLKKGNAEERKQVSQAELDKIKALREANDKYFALDKKRIDDELKNNEDAIQRKKDLIINSPYSTDMQKLDAEKLYYEESTTAQIQYNQKMFDIQDQYNKRTVEEVNALMRTLKEKLDAENRNKQGYRFGVVRNALKLSDDTADEMFNANEILASSERKSVLQNKELTDAERKIELQKISAQLELRNTNVELGNVIAKIRLLEIEMQNRELTNDEMREFNRLLKERQSLEENKAIAENNVRVTGASVAVGAPGSGVSGLASSLTNKLKNSDGQLTLGGKDVSEQLGYAIAESFNIAQQAMNDYFDMERQRIEQSKQLAYERIDLETKQLQRFAQSSAEKESIEQQANEKKKKADKDAGEKLKKIKKNEARIAFLLELGNIWSTAMQLGPIAGPIMGAVLSTIATIRFGATMANIDKVQYKKGGRFFGAGGKLNGPSHSDGGMPVFDPITGTKVAEMEGGEAIINQNTMSDKGFYNVSGTPSQIASKLNSIGGGVDWDGGATMKKFMNGGKYLGSNLQPPALRNINSNNSGSFYVNDQNTERLERIEETIFELALLQKQESAKRVYLPQRDIQDSLKENRKRGEIASL